MFKLIIAVLKKVRTISRSKKILGMLTIAGLLYFIFTSLQTSKQDTVTLYTVKRGDIAETIVNSGNVNISGNASVYSPSTGIVEEIYVANGDSVTEGQQLLQVKSTATEIEKSNALAAYQAALATLNTARQTKIANQSLLESGRKAVLDASIVLQQLTDRRALGQNNPATNKQYTQDEIESITSLYTSSKKSFESLEKKFIDSDAAITAAQGAATAAKFSYQATLNGIIKAPISGIITNLSVGKGDAVNVKTTSLVNTQETVPVLRISTPERASVVVKLSEIDVAKIIPGLSASVVFDAIPDKTFSAEVARVDTVGVNENAVVTYNAYLLITEMDDRIRPAMTATITIQTAQKKDVLLIPNTALAREDNKTVVQIRKGKSTEKRSVVVGIKNTQESEILEGLSEGDILLVENKQK